MTSTTLADPVRVESDRMINFRWTVADVEPDGLRPAGSRCAELSIYHSRHHRAIQASIHPIIVYTDGGTRTTHSLTGPYWGLSEPIERFTQKRLEAIAQTMLATFRRDALDGHPAIAALFEAGQ